MAHQRHHWDKLTPLPLHTISNEEREERVIRKAERFGDAEISTRDAEERPGRDHIIG